MSSAFKWDEKKSLAVIELAQGKTQVEVSKIVGITDRNLRLWLAEEEFSAEVDRLSLMVGIASRAERLRIAMRVARQRINAEGAIETDKDLLDWLKFVQSETDGIKLDLTAISEAAASVAESRPDRTSDKAGAKGRKAKSTKAR
jgi:hypothetical protein